MTTPPTEPTRPAYHTGPWPPPHQPTPGVLGRSTPPTNPLPVSPTKAQDPTLTARLGGAAIILTVFALIIAVVTLVPALILFAAALILTAIAGFAARPSRPTR